MKISYRREMKRNYLIVEPEELRWRGYEYQMILEHSISGLLPFSMMQTDGQTRFYYEITSRQPLTRLLEGRTISEEEIRCLVFGIARMLDQLDLYLLSESSILLAPEYIYVEPDSFQLWLCLVPGLNQDFPQSYSRLLEYLLGHVDHQNRDCVVLTYGLYQETRKENYGIEDIMKLMQEHGSRSVRPEEIKIPDPPISVDVFSGIGAVKEADGRKKPKGLFGRKRNKAEKAQEKEAPLPWKHIIMDTTETSVTDFVPTGQGTALLSDAAERGAGGYACLQSQDGETEDIVLPYFPFVIGKQANLVDYVLDKNTVSRLHLKIDQNGEQYMITDLNSTNGTWVGGKQLNNNETVILIPCEEVQIAEYKYKFLPFIT